MEVPAMGLDLGCMRRGAEEVVEAANRSGLRTGHDREQGLGFDYVPADVDTVTVTDPDRMRGTELTGRVRLHVNALGRMAQAKDPCHMLCIGTMALVILLANVVGSELAALVKVLCMGRNGSQEVQGKRREFGSGSHPRGRESVRECTSHVVMVALAKHLVLGTGNRLAVPVSATERVSHAAREVLARLRVASIAVPPEAPASVRARVSSVVTAVLARPPVASRHVLVEVLASGREYVSFAATAVLAKRLGRQTVSSIRVVAIRRADSMALSTWAQAMGSRRSRSTIAS
jgi:hypothetical protein